MLLQGGGRPPTTGMPACRAHTGAFRFRSGQKPSEVQNLSTEVGVAFWRILILVVIIIVIIVIIK